MVIRVRHQVARVAQQSKYINIDMKNIVSIEILILIGSTYSL